ncbi:MAG: response regulator [Treponema porcinum]|uniref:response regulator n=1 Tax=Treponema porcinum TaxID=261392 RepID=UPI002356271A|nr:response regulator [Treponema porcinum]MCI5645138.1 response regulator [Treponema porcinum]MCI6481690.1 response regulator [Treponema porcinum]MDY4468609.1 response regulator [Treponema porcinum]MDY5120359.1 response regulator [Treponema porcinum]
MKNVLVVDASPIFSEFLKDKFSEEKIEVTFIQDKLDSIPKMISMLPDLVILDINETDNPAFLLDYLQKIKADPNASRIPLIATGPVMDRKEIALFAKFGIHKYFIKPIKFDFFFDSIGTILRTAFSMDTTPCVLDIHCNGNIIFIEIAQGLNREKLSLLRYKLSEIIEKTALDAPKVVIMMTNLDLTFVDGLNIELLLNNILANHKIQNKNVKILSFSTFTKELIDGHPEYAGIEVVTDISHVLNSLVDSSSTAHVSDLITDRILTNNDTESGGSIEMRFSTDTNAPSRSEQLAEGVDPYLKHIAIVDDDSVVLDLLASTFRAKRFHVDTFNNGVVFLEAVTEKKYDLIVLDIMMPGLSGIDTLMKLKELPEFPVIFIYSQAMKKELIIKSLSMGAKQYFVKPQKPEVILNKAVEMFIAPAKK